MGRRALREAARRSRRPRLRAQCATQCLIDPENVPGRPNVRDGKCPSRPRATAPPRARATDGAAGSAGSSGSAASGGSSQAVQARPPPPNDRTASADAATAFAAPIGHERCDGSRIDRAGRLVADRRA
ncbi:hypothetical protein EGY16_12095 [Burkholderia pseudomallei]|nr:hypothetical protein BOC51_03870 [Burkholderia pseudomallei]AYX28750.1 hypothetical protein EGY16_12095 [Burkholderia pseudomallei]AYX37059.1 hypothetical protein EGY15_19745 [Burkholderia pseudomallei]KAA8771309.1 hypothetical protein F5D26_01720 [Burkholderia pseudomallei]